jgi:hypothetical protein
MMGIVNGEILVCFTVDAYCPVDSGIYIIFITPCLDDIDGEVDVSYGGVVEAS